MEKKDKLVMNGLEIETPCFNEYYYIIPQGIIKPKNEKMKIYRVGDELPVSGETYEFPKNFNLIDLHSNLTAEIRFSKLVNITPLEKFEYDGLPALNIMGFFIKLHSEQDLKDLKDDFNSFEANEKEKLKSFANKWFDIVKYRTIKYSWE